MADWEQQLDSKRAGRRISPSQGMGEETQQPPSGGTTGVGAAAFGTAAGLAGLRMRPLAAESIAAAGAGVGDLAETALQQALDPEREVNVGGALKSAGKEMIASLIGGGTVRGVVKVGDKLNQVAMGKIFDRVSSQTTPEAQVALSVLDRRAEAAGIPALTPAERTQSAWWDFFDNIAKNSVVGSNLYRKWIVKRENITKDLAGEYIRQFGAASQDPASLGKMLSTVIRSNKELSFAPAQLLRNQVEAQVSQLGLKADVTAIRQHARGVLRDIEVTGGLTAKTQGKKPMDAVVEATDRSRKEIFDPLANFSPQMPVANLIKVRTGLLEEQRRVGMDKKLRGMSISRNIGEQIELVNKAIENGLKQPGSSPDLLAAWKKQNDMFRSTNTEFGDELATQIIRAAEKNPAGIVDAVLRSSTQDGYNLVKKAKKILLPTNLKEASISGFDLSNLPITVSTLPWKKFQAGMVKSIFDEARDSAGSYSGVKFINRLNDIGKLTLTESFGPQTTKELFDFATTLAVVQKKNPVGIGSMGIQMVQAGAVLSLPFDPTFTAAFVLLGPAMMAKIFTTRDGVRMFRQGLLMERTDPRWRAMLGRLVTMGSVNYMEPDNAPRPQKTSSREDPLLKELMRGPAISQ